MEELNDVRPYIDFSDDDKIDIKLDADRENDNSNPVSWQQKTIYVHKFIELLEEKKFGKHDLKHVPGTCCAFLFIRTFKSL